MTTRYTVDLAGGEATQTTEDRTAEEPRSGFEEFVGRIAAGEDGPLPDNVREDAELHGALRARSDEEHFGDAPGDGLSDEAMWGQYREALGMEEG